MNSLSSFESLENLAFLLFFSRQVFLSCKQEKDMKFQCPEWQKGQKQKGNRKIYVDDDDDDDDDDNEMMIKRWVCTGKDPLHLFRVRECQDLYSANKWIISMLSSLSVFITEFCFDRLPQMAVIKEIVQLLPICSISWPSLFCFCFGLKQSQGTKPISRNGYGPDWLRRFIDPIAMPCWWAPIRA